MSVMLQEGLCGDMPRWCIDWWQGQQVSTCSSLSPAVGDFAGGLTSFRRFILANTEQLHDKIKAMSVRIRELEDALGDLKPGHPLLREDLLLIKKSADLFGVDPNQPMAEIRRHPDAMQHGLAAPASPSMLHDVSNHLPNCDTGHVPVPRAPGIRGSVATSHAHIVHDKRGQPAPQRRLRKDYVVSCENGILIDSSQRQSHSPPANGNHEDYGIPMDILQVSERFPAPSALSVDLNPNLRKRILDLLPPQHEARRLCEQAAEHAAWQCV